MSRKQIYFLVAIVLLVILLSACDTSKVRIGEVRMMYGTNQDGLISYDVTSFKGIEKGSLQVQQGQNITFDFNVNVNKGSLIIEWQDSEGEVLWSKELFESELGHEDLPGNLPGEYTVLVQGKGFGGSFEVSWGIK